MARLARPVQSDTLQIERYCGHLTARAVVGFSGYFAGEDGQIYSARWVGGRRPSNPLRQSVRVLRSYADKRGYHSVYLYRGDGRRICHRVHVLVAQAWHGKRPRRRLVVRHMNHDKADCRPANLKWGTQSANVYDWQRKRWEDRQVASETPAGECPF